LTPTTRRILLSDGNFALLSDTVRFYPKIAPNIIKAFRATLEELEEANLLLNVIDFSLALRGGRRMTRWKIF